MNCEECKAMEIWDCNECQSPPAIADNCKSCIHAQRDGCDDNTPNCPGYHPEAWKEE